MKLHEISFKFAFSLIAVLLVSACTTYQPSAEVGVWTNSEGESVQVESLSQDVKSIAVDMPIPEKKPYRLRAGDCLDLTIEHLEPVRNDNLKLTSMGDVDLPIVGEMRLAGLTLKEARQQLAAKYATIFVGARVILRIKERHPPCCFVLGQVGSPGLQEIEGGAKLVEVISRAGGFTYLDRRDALGASDIQRAFVARGEGIVPVDFEALFLRGDMSHNIDILEGDMVVVPDNTHREVVVLGSVNKPGVIPMSTGAINVLAAIGHAGGFSKFADMQTVAVVRNIESKPIVTLVNTEQVLDAKSPALILKSGDVVFVAQDDIKALDIPGILKSAASGVIVAMGVGAGG